MKIKISIFLLLTAVNFFPQTLNGKLDNLFTSPYFESTMASVDVYDLTSKAFVYSRNNRLLLHPASNMKILTSAAGLLFLGPDYNFKTKVCYSGFIKNDTLKGDIYIIGGFDPELSDKGLDTIVNNIASLGIRYIDGALYGDTSMMDNFFWGSGWMWDDDPSTDAPYMSSLNINGNTVTVTAEAKTAGKPADITLYPESGYFKIKNNSVVADTGSKLYITRDWVNRENTIIISGTLPQDKRVTKKLNVFRPELYLVTLLKEKLSASGINCKKAENTGVVPPHAIEIFSVNRRFDSVLVNLNKQSDNLNAEMTLRALAAKYYGIPASAENGLLMVDSLIVLAGLDPQKYHFADGSGVSRYNLVSSECLLKVLVYLYNSHPALFKILYDSFPEAGIDGTLKNRMKGTKGEKNVHAKTGTLSGVSCLSGYLTNSAGHLLAFSIMFQNYIGSNAEAIEYQSKICNILVE